jgi:hypothetical protein
VIIDRVIYHEMATDRSPLLDDLLDKCRSAADARGPELRA